MLYKRYAFCSTSPPPDLDAERRLLNERRKKPHTNLLIGATLMGSLGTEQVLRWRIQLLSVRTGVFFLISSRICRRSCSA